MISIIKGRMEHRCAGCSRTIESGSLKIKDNQDNHIRRYFHLKCCPKQIIDTHLQLWTLAKQESERQ